MVTAVDVPWKVRVRCNAMGTAVVFSLHNQCISEVDAVKSNILDSEGVHVRVSESEVVHVRVSESEVSHEVGSDRVRRSPQDLFHIKCQHQPGQTAFDAARKNV